MCLTPGPAGAPGELPGGDVVALVLKQPPAVRTLCTDTFCRNTSRKRPFPINSRIIAEFEPLYAVFPL